LKFEPSDSIEAKRRFKLVRRDDFTDVEGQIISADEATGECCLQVGEETKTLSLGEKGFRIVSRRR
jgi:hypothetical protein